MLNQTTRPLTDDERYLLLAERNRATDWGRNSGRDRWVATTLGTLAGVALGLLLAAGLRAAGAPETACRLAAIVVATAASVLAFETAHIRQRRVLEGAIQVAGEIDRTLADGTVAVQEVRASRAARVTDAAEDFEDSGWLLDLGAEGTLFIRTDPDLVPEGFPADAFRFAVGDGRGAIDEAIAVTGAPLAPTAHAVYTDLWSLCDRSLYPVPFDDALADPSQLAAAPQGA